MKADNRELLDLQHRIADGDQEAFCALYRQFFPRLHSFASLYVRQKESAEEIVNDVMVKLWEKRMNLLQIGNLETYLFVAVKNHCLNHLEKFSSVYIQQVDDTGQSQLVNVNDPEKELEWKEISFQLKLAVESLPGQCKTVFKLIKEEGFKYKEVAEILGLSVRTVETQLQRALRKLSTVIILFTDKPISKKADNGIKE
jgi:RNA polymerase sigma-70 factor (ECF subfamily)